MKYYIAEHEESGFVWSGEALGWEELPTLIKAIAASRGLLSGIIHVLEITEEEFEALGKRASHVGWTELDLESHTVLDVIGPVSNN